MSKAGNGEALWSETNRAALVAGFARLKELLAAQSDNQTPASAETAPLAMDPPAALDRIAELFDLSGFERSVLLLCAGAEMDSQIASLCGAAQGFPQRTYATFGLAMALLPDAHWNALAYSHPLRRFRLVEIESGHGLTSATLRIDERILHYLTGVNALDLRLQAFLQLAPFPYWISESHRATADQLIKSLNSGQDDPPIVHLCGNDPQGQEDAAALAASKHGRHLFILRAEDLPPAGSDLNQLSVLWERESRLLPGALLLRCPSSGLSAPARHLIERLPGPLFLSSQEPVRLSRRFVRFDVDKPPPDEQKRAWQKALGQSAGKFNGVLDALSEQFRLSAKIIFVTGATAASEQNSFGPDELWNACRALARPRLEDLAERIVPAAKWDDLVLSETQKQILRQLAAQVQHRLKVYETWGFSDKGRRGLGVSALFAGGSGTGKTMAAEVLAGELRLDLYRIDLSAVVSKYIGETEKNLKQVFDAAEEGGVMLLFDEADALFGKRGEVKDSHDRYANIEVGFLLQRMEAYQGLAILTTNLKSSLDKSFQRRLRFSVNFPFPDAAQREAIWRRVFPAQTPTHGLEPTLLAQLNMTGGNIRNIALNAAFIAAAEERSVEMKHLLEAARLEAQKIERPLANAEIRGWV
jgi:AAA+ superfamily predicted ATPase